ncbi:MAG: hypothetical protein JRH20_18290 [Deltaproteobacteria bacterium]|nr:hypothetical protein [Deltaproteobacteria bacterium]
METQLTAESLRREAAEAEAEAARALAYEHKLKAEGGVPLRPVSFAALFWPLVLLMAVSTVASLYLGAWHARLREARWRPMPPQVQTTTWTPCAHVQTHMRAVIKRHPQFKKALDKPRITALREDGTAKTPRDPFDPRCFQ